MPRQPSVVAETNFSGGLKTEFTGLNFPENSVTDTLNCIFNRDGSVERRKAIDYETGYTFNINVTDMTDVAVNTYVWKNADGAGLVDLYVLQLGHSLFFYDITASTPTSPLSVHIIDTSGSGFLGYATGSGSLTSNECQFSTGNGYLFVFHPYSEPFYCSYESGVVTTNPITVKIRDLSGIEEDIDDNFRPGTLTDEHNYNLANQGWNKSWSLLSTTTVSIGTGSKTFDITSSAPVLVGDRVRIFAGSGFATGSSGEFYMVGVVTEYVANDHITVNVSEAVDSGSLGSWVIAAEPPLINTWYNAVGNYPANSDVWWYFKTVQMTGTQDAEGAPGDEITLNQKTKEVFDPAETINDVTTASGPAPKGFFILDAFEQSRSTSSGISGLDDVTSNGTRPRTGCWFQGRVWYSGVNAKEFNEKIYFSQIIENKSQFGKCYQVNDPTSEERFDLLPSDGGVIVIQGAGQIVKLFPIQNGLLVFTNQGIWFITGSQGIGFTANDYTVTKISSIQTLSATSFVNVQGFPVFWNEEGIYAVSPGQQGSLTVQSMTDTTIATFYKDIPTVSRKYARGDFDPVKGIIQWVYKTEEETDTIDRYHFDGILNFNILTQAWYPWKVGVFDSGAIPYILDAKYIQGTGDVGSLESKIRYMITRLDVSPKYYFSTAHEREDDIYYDFYSLGVPGELDYDSYFVSGYKLTGQAQRKFQSNYVYVYSDNFADTSYRIFGMWDFADNPNSGEWTNRQQQVVIAQDNYKYAYRRHKIRGSGIALQISILSSPGEPFHILGWSMWETQNAHV